MSWNQRRYEAGMHDALYSYEMYNHDLEALEREYFEILAVDEFEVGWRDAVISSYISADRVVDAGRFFWMSQVTQEYKDRAKALVDQDLAFWKQDPEFPDVVGLVRRDDPKKALVVVYLDEHKDHEEGEGFWDYDGTPYGKGADHCPWCGADWKAPHERGCTRPEDDDERAPCVKGTPGCSRKDGPHEDCETY